MLTAITTSAPIRRTTSTGRLSTSPPSPRILAFDLGGREHAGDRHAGAHRLVQRPRLEHVGLARHHVGRDARNGIGRRFEVLDAIGARSRARAGTASGSPRKARPGSRGSRLPRMPISSGSGKRRSISFSRKLSSRRGGESENNVVQSTVVMMCSMSARRHAHRVEAADDRAHRRRGDVVDRDVGLLEHLEHPDVGDPAGAAAGEHEADLGAPGFRGRHRRRRRLRERLNGDDEERARGKRADGGNTAAMARVRHVGWEGTSGRAHGEDAEL